LSLSVIISIDSTLGRLIGGELGLFSIIILTS